MHERIYMATVSWHAQFHYSIIMVRRLFWSMVCLTAWNTKRMFSVSTAVVKWWKSGFVRHRLRESSRLSSKFCTSVNSCGLPRNCGKYDATFTSLIFNSSRSVLLRKRMMDTCENDLLLTIVSKMLHDSMKRLVLRSSKSTWSNSELATRKTMDVTESKHWNHFCRCNRWPPTSTNINGMPRMSNRCSAMPLVALRACKTSTRDGR